MSTSVVVLPNIQLPEHLRSPEAVAARAQANANAAGGIPLGGFPTISLKANHFNLRRGGENTVMMAKPDKPGQPATPLACLEIVVLDSNPSVSKVYFKKQWVEGQDSEPDCRSANGVTPDADIFAPQHTNCATCPMNQWGSALSKVTGKEIKACSDSKQLAVLPAGDLTFDALGLRIGAGSQSNWRKYIAALNERPWYITEVVTNVTFDPTSNGVLQFSFNRFLTAEELSVARRRAAGDDVRTIVSQTRSGSAPAAPALPRGEAALQAAPGVVQGANVVAAPTEAEAPRRTRRSRAQIEADEAAAKATQEARVEDELAHLPPEIKAAVQALGVNSLPGKALLDKYPKPDAPKAEPAPDPLAHLPPEIKAAVQALGADSVPGKALLEQYLPKDDVAPAPAAATVPVAPAAPAIPASVQSLQEQLKAKLAALGK